MGTIAVYGLLAVTPAAVFWAFAGACQWLARTKPAGDTPASASRSIERLAQDLARLGREQRKLRSTDPPAKAARLRSLMLAYDDTLSEAASALSLPPPSAPPLDEATRLEIELALTQRGLVW